MANRRQFLGGSIAGTALLSAFSAHAGTLLTDPAHKTLSHFVFDERSIEARQLAQDMKPIGVTTLGIQSDASDVWYKKLAPRVQAGANVIGGLTTAGGLFTLTRLGFDAGLRLALHGQHRLFDDGRESEHVLKTSAVVARSFDAALASGLSWTSALQVVFPDLVSQPTADRVALGDISSPDSARQTTLHSWILMPRA